MRSPYETLGVPLYATNDEIKQAWRRLCRKHHPDRNNGNADMMSVINEAYNALMDTEWRARFDQTGDGTPPLSVDAEARNSIMQFLVSILMMEVEVPIYESVLELIQNNVVAQERAQAKAERKLKKIDRQVKTLKLTEVGKGHFSELFLQMSAALEEDKAKAARLLDALKRAGEMWLEVASKIKDGKEALSYFDVGSGVKRLPT